MDETQVTELLRELSGGRREALDELMPVVYGELKRIADRRLRDERPDHTLGATALVHEAYMKLVSLREIHWQDRAHFYAMASRQMRRVLIDHARALGSHKRGGDRFRVTLSEAMPAQAADADELIALDDALRALEEVDERSCRVVECRCFGGLTVEETAAALKASTATVKRDWAFARAWLNRALTEGVPEPNGA
jgi:RNA polymerase sigma factor (TIGR02999 family)